jgi:hypothetical protein
MQKFSNFSFGATSAVVTSLAIIVGLGGAENAKLTIISALLIIAIADNISDSFGIHIHEESKHIPAREIRRTTTNNFTTRLVITFIFILFVSAMPMGAAVASSVIFGVLVITALSYFISKDQKTSPYLAIFHHLAIALVVMAASFFMRKIITNLVMHFG